MRIRVLLFGAEAQRVGQPHVDLELPHAAATCGQVRAALAAVPTLAGMLRHCRIAVNDTFGHDDQPLGKEDEVALIGMVSGG